MINSKYTNYEKIVEFLEEYTLIEKNNDNYYNKVDQLIFSDKYKECEEDLITIVKILEDKYIHMLLECIDEEIFKFINILSDLERLEIYSKKDLLNVLEMYGDEEDITSLKHIINKKIRIEKHNELKEENSAYPFDEMDKSELTDGNDSDDPFYDFNKHKIPETITLEYKTLCWIDNPEFDVGYWDYLNDEEREIVRSKFIEIWYRDITDRFEWFEEIQKVEALYYQYLLEITGVDNTEIYFENKENNTNQSKHKNSRTKALELKALEWILNPTFNEDYWDYLNDEEREIVASLFLKEWENNLHDHLQWERKIKEEEVFLHKYIYEITGEKNCEYCESYECLVCPVCHVCSASCECSENPFAF